MVDKVWSAHRWPRVVLSVSMIFPLVLGGIVGCSGNQKESASLTQPAYRKPFQMIKSDPAALRAVRRIVVAPVQFSQQAKSAEGKASLFDSSLAELAVGRLGVETISGEEVTTFLAAESQAVPSDGRSADAALRQKLQSQFNADAVLEVHLNEFIELSGSAVGADSTAVVGVRYRLFQQGREPIWESQYYFRDKALSDDFLSAQNRFGSGPGAGWRNATTLVQSSMEQALQALENDREKSFLGTQ